MTELRDWQAELDRCAVCGKCRAFCPVFAETLDETRVARGRIRLAKAYLRGDVGATRKLGDYVGSCLKCMRCQANCPSGVDYALILDMVRAEMVRKRPLPFLLRLVLRRLLFWRRGFNAAMRLAGFFSKLIPRRGRRLRHLPLFLLGGRGVPPLAKETSLSWAARRIPRPGREVVAFFTGCMMNYAYPEAVKSCVEVLERLRLQVVIPRDQVCCGAPALTVGDLKVVKKLARRNKEALLRRRPSVILTGCASCTSTLRVEYPKLFGEEFEEFSSRVQSFSEFLAERGEIEWKQGAEKVTFHDPCHLKWVQDIYLEPRTLLRKAAEFVEMEDADSCCGLGGLFSLFHPDISGEIGRKKAEAVVRSGAEIVATECPGCMFQLQERLSAVRADVEVKHIGEILREAVVKGKLRERIEKVGAS